MKILCPIDFSHHSKMALEYAISLINILNAELHVLSVKNNEDQGNISLRNQQESLTAGVTPLLNSDFLPVLNVIEGNIAPTILQYCEKNEIDLVIMGTQGINNMKNILLGSIAEEIALKSKVPVLAIPENNFDILENSSIILSLDNQEVESDSIFDIPKKIANALNTKIDILHIVSEDEKDLPFDPFVFNFLEDSAGTTELVKGENVLHSLNNYIEENDTGLVIMIRRKKGFFKELFSIHNSMEQIIISKIPVLVVPEA